MRESRANMEGWLGQHGGGNKADLHEGLSNGRFWRNEEESRTKASQDLSYRGRTDLFPTLH